MVESLKFKSGEEKDGEEKGKQKSHTIGGCMAFIVE